jgi:hypothetical protein
MRGSNTWMDNFLYKTQIKVARYGADFERELSRL